MMNPEYDDGPTQERLLDEFKILQDQSKKLFERMHSKGTRIWSGTMKSHHDVHRIECIIKMLPEDAAMKSVFPEQLDMRIVPKTVSVSLDDYEKQSKGLICSVKNNTMSYSAFSKAIRLDKSKMGCAVLKHTSSTLHVLFLESFSNGNEDHIVGDIVMYKRYDEIVLNTLQSEGLLSCVNLQHLNQEQVMYQQQISEKEEELETLHQKVKELKRLTKEKQEELARVRNQRDVMKKTVIEKDIALSERDSKIIVKGITMIKNTNALKRKNRKLLLLRRKFLLLQSKEERSKTSRSKRLKLVAIKHARIKRMMKEDGECGICKGLFIKATTLNCSHSFCNHCIQMRWKVNTTCPHCHEEMEYGIRNIPLDNFIQGIVHRLGKKFEQRRKKAVKKREREMLEAGLYLDSENSSQPDDDPSFVTRFSSSSSSASPLQQLSVNATFTSYSPEQSEL